MVEIDLAAAERTVRADHYEVCRWPHDDVPGQCVGDCEMVCYADGEVWPCAADTLLAEYDRRGQIEQRASEMETAGDRLMAAARSLAYKWETDSSDKQVWDAWKKVGPASDAWMTARRSGDGDSSWTAAAAPDAQPLSGED